MFLHILLKVLVGPSYGTAEPIIQTMMMFVICRASIPFKSCNQLKSAI